MAIWSKLKFISDGKDLCLYVIGHIPFAETIEMISKYFWKSACGVAGEMAHSTGVERIKTVS